MLERIVADGITDGSFKLEDAHAVAQAAFDAAVRFHDPVHGAKGGEESGTGEVRGHLA